MTKLENYSFQKVYCDGRTNLPSGRHVFVAFDWEGEGIYFKRREATLNLELMQSSSVSLVTDAENFKSTLR